MTYPAAFPPRTLVERRVGDVIILDLDGALTQVAGVALSDWMRGSTSDKILLNLARVSYLDSAGLGAIIEAYAGTTRRAAALKCVGLTPRTRHVFEITGFLGFVETFDSESAALASFAEASDAGRP